MCHRDTCGTRFPEKTADTLTGLLFVLRRPAGCILCDQLIPHAHSGLSKRATICQVRMIVLLRHSRHSSVRTKYCTFVANASRGTWIEERINSTIDIEFYNRTFLPPFASGIIRPRKFARIHFYREILKEIKFNFLRERFQQIKSAAKLY